MTHSLTLQDCNGFLFGDVTFSRDQEDNDGVCILRNDFITVDLDRTQVKHLITFLQSVVDEQEAAEAPEEPTPAVTHVPSYANLPEQAQKVYRHMARAGSISAREAMNDHGITSATLSRRICDIEEEGFVIIRERKVHPITSRRYTRYSIKGTSA